MGEIEYYQLHSHEFYETNHNGEDYIWEVKVINIHGSSRFQAQIIQDELGIKTKWKVVRGEYLALDVNLMIRKEIANLK
ncbi:hypothetical protein [Alkalicoccobacillus murimartini]|uniref:Uncharacterized protein n=1 Tax=Alkalicoccobacillus murimartini TaxID=171685 RepID=A0ABT9YDK4_9BACI|nr:hypothetical protein [Alkalicoccobacillus murimartini]MDQ0205811.1 hypothetical protein [Alkalicoccobacillus murimartini]